MNADKKTALRKKVGKSIRTWRKGEGLVLTEISSQIKISQGSLSDLENGKCFPSFPTVVMFKKKYPKADWDKILFT